MTNNRRNGLSRWEREEDFGGDRFKRNYDERRDVVVESAPVKPDLTTAAGLGDAIKIAEDKAYRINKQRTPDGYLSPSFTGTLAKLEARIAKFRAALAELSTAEATPVKAAEVEAPAAIQEDAAEEMATASARLETAERTADALRALRADSGLSKRQEDELTKAEADAENLRAEHKAAIARYRNAATVYRADAPEGRISVDTGPFVRLNTGSTTEGATFDGDTLVTLQTGRRLALTPAFVERVRETRRAAHTHPGVQYLEFGAGERA